MYEYECMNCNKPIEIDLNAVKKIICPSCGYRILEKKRPKIINKVHSV